MISTFSTASERILNLARRTTNVVAKSTATRYGYLQVAYVSDCARSIPMRTQPTMIVIRPSMKITNRPAFSPFSNPLIVLNSGSGNRNTSMRQRLSIGPGLTQYNKTY